RARLLPAWRRAARLPLVYLMIAGLAGVITQLPSRRRRSPSYALSLLLGGSAGVTFFFWLLGRWRSPVELYALYVWTGLVGSLAVLQFYVVLADMYTVTQAKRIYGLVGTGSLLGAVAGAGLARILTGSAPASRLVLVAAVTMALTAIGPALWLRGGVVAPVPARSGATLRQSMEMLRRQPYVRGLAGLTLVSTV